MKDSVRLRQRLSECIRGLTMQFVSKRRRIRTFYAERLKCVHRCLNAVRFGIRRIEKAAVELRILKLRESNSRSSCHQCVHQTGRAAVQIENKIEAPREKSKRFRLLADCENFVDV